MKALYTLIILLIPFVGFGQKFSSHCYNQYFSVKSNFFGDENEFPSTTFLNLSYDNQNYDITDGLMGISLSFNTIPNNAYNYFSALISQNDDIYVSAQGNRTYKFPTALNQFELDFDNDNYESPVLTWQPIDTTYGGCNFQGNASNTDFCQNFNGDIYYAQCANGGTAVLNISTPSYSVIAQEITGGNVRSLVSHPNDTIFYLANATSVFSFFPSTIGYTELNLPNADYISSMEIDNDGNLYVVYFILNEDSVSGTFSIAKGIDYNQSWEIIFSDGNFYTGGQSKILDFDSNNIGYLLSLNEYGGDLCLYKIENDSVNLFNNFNINAESFAIEIDNYGNPHIVYVDNEDNLSVNSFNGSDWTNIFLGLGMGDQIDYLDIQFNSYNDLYLLFEGKEGNTDIATVLTLLNCSIVTADSWNCVNNACVDPLDGSGEFSTLNDCEQVCQNISSIVETNLDINIYPNPSSNIFNLELNSDSEAEITVTNVLGEQVYFESTQSIGEFNTQIDLSDYSKGIYNLTLKTSDGLSNHKLILQ